MTDTVWASIEKALRDRGGSTDELLGAGATDEDLAKLQALLAPHALPEAFVLAWKQHDGEALGRDDTLVRGRLLLPLRAIASEYETMREVAEKNPYDVEADVGVRREMFAKGWVPFVLLGGSSDFHCVDLDPADGGTPGQIIAVSHEITPRTVVAKDLASYFSNFAARISGGDATDSSDPRADSTTSAPVRDRSIQRVPSEAPAKSSAVSAGLAVAFWGTLVYAFVRSSKVAGFFAFVLWLTYVLLRFAQRRAGRAV